MSNVQESSQSGTQSPTKSQPPALRAESNGLLVGTTLEEQYRLAQVYVRSGLIPKSYDTPEKVLCGMQYAREFGLAPLSALRNIAVIQGTPSFYGDLPLGIVRGSGKIKSIKEEIFDKNGVEISRANKNLSAEPFGAECTVVRDTGEMAAKTYTIDDAKNAGLLGKPGPWQQHRKRMLQLRARAWALKDLFGDVLSGAVISEYDLDSLPEAGIVQEKADKVNQLKAALSEKPVEKDVDCVVEHAVNIPADPQQPPKEIVLPSFDFDGGMQIER